MNRNKIITVFLLCVAAILSCVQVRYLSDVLLNHIGTIFILALLCTDIYKRFFSYTSFLCISIFCFFHIIGARYVYSNVPYNDWLIGATGWDVNTCFELTRNHYDRFIHFIFGILIFPCLIELFRRSIMKYSHSLAFSWLAIQTLSMIYELIEWVVALTLSEKSAENYNGQQGDIWDAHKDMALALFGSTIMYVIYLLKRERSSPIRH